MQVQDVQLGGSTMSTPALRSPATLRQALKGDASHPKRPTDPGGGVQGMGQKQRFLINLGNMYITLIDVKLSA